MTIRDLKIQSQSFSGIVLKGKEKYKIEGSFRTSHQDYPEDKTAPLYASTIVFKILDSKGKELEITESENQEIEESLEEQIDGVLSPEE